MNELTQHQILIEFEAILQKHNIPEDQVKGMVKVVKVLMYKMTHLKGYKK